jgi:hypothetical protein
MESSSLAQQIKAAFPLLPLPEVSLHQAQLLDQTMSRELTEAEWEAAGAQDSGRTWQAFTEDELIACDSALSHLDESDFIYYLPAFLLLALRHLEVKWDHPAWTITGSAVFSVTSRSGYSLSRFARFTPEQVAAVTAFLNAVAQSSGSNAQDARVALDRYWNTDRAGKFLLLP